MKYRLILFVVIFILFLSARFVLPNLKIMSSYSGNNPQKEEDLPEQDEKPIEIIVTGDIMLGRSVMKKSININDYNYPFRKVFGITQSADIVFANLENPLVGGCKIHESGFTFCADPEMVKGLKFAGINVVSLANNHSHNYGKSGFNETISILNENQIFSVGYGNLQVIEIKGLKFGFVGFDFVSNQPSSYDYQLIKDASRQVDQLLVGVHWGSEYQSLANTNQRLIARKMVENGADVIIGHHPHWVQNYEDIEGKPVYYSLGNFVFDQMWSEETRNGMAVRLKYRNNVLISREMLPLYIAEIGQPQFVVETLNIVPNQ